MKVFIDRIFKKRKQDAEQIEENKRIISEQIETSIKAHIVQNQATEAAVEAIVEEVKQEETIIYSRPGHYFPDCNCIKCVKWRNQNA